MVAVKCQGTRVTTIILEKGVEGGGMDWIGFRKESL